MADVLYSTTEAIRSAIGMQDIELPDAVFTDQDLAVQMRTSLYGFVPAHATLYAAGEEVGATDQEVYIRDLLSQYCMFFGAVRMLESPWHARKQVSDGKSQVQRFDIDWLELLKNLKAKLKEVADLLDEQVNGSVDGIPYFGLARPDYDPVTNT